MLLASDNSVNTISFLLFIVWTWNGIQAFTAKTDFLALASRTQRGFTASREELQYARELIFELSNQCKTNGILAGKNGAGPTSDYYDSKDNLRNSSNPSSITGKWTLVFTDAPDITSLQQNPLAELGRIGQECRPPYINNVIEWKQPSWSYSVPFLGGKEPNSNTRIIQKVLTKASASPDKPTIVNLELAGFEVMSPEDDDTNTSGNFQNTLQKKGLVAGLATIYPLSLQGPFTAPFGQFELLYLDNDLRVIRTQQGYYAANIRIEDRTDEWF